MSTVNNFKPIDAWNNQKNFSVPAHQELVDRLNDLGGLDDDGGEGELYQTPYGRGSRSPFDARGIELIEAVPLSYIIPPEDSTFKGEKLRKYMICKLADGQKVACQVARHHVPYDDAGGDNVFPVEGEDKMYVCRPASYRAEKLNMPRVQDTDSSDEDETNPKYQIEAVEVSLTTPILYGKLSEDYDAGTPKLIKVTPYQENLTDNIGLPDEDVYLVAPDSTTTGFDPKLTVGDLILYILVERTASDGTKDPFFLRINSATGGGALRFKVTTAGPDPDLGDGLFTAMTWSGDSVLGSDPVSIIATCGYQDVDAIIWAVPVTNVPDTWIQIPNLPLSTDKYKVLQVDDMGRYVIHTTRLL